MILSFQTLGHRCSKERRRGRRGQAFFGTRHADALENQAGIPGSVANLASHEKRKVQPGEATGVFQILPSVGVDSFYFDSRLTRALVLTRL